MKDQILRKKQIISFLLIFLLTSFIGLTSAVAQNYASTTVNDGLMAYYPFDGNANDASGNGYHATPCNNFQYEEGVVGASIAVVGEGHCVSTGGHVLLPEFDFDVSSGVTLSLWVKALSLSNEEGETYISLGTSVVFEKDYHSERLDILQMPTTISFDYRETEITIPFEDSYVGTWVMYTLACSSDGTMRAYVNGELVGEANVDYDGQLYASLAALGRHWWDYYDGMRTSTRFTGSFDEVRIYNRAITSQEVSLLYNSNHNEGTLPGLFSVGENTQVYFSQGNLQYQASTNTWRFAENQWDYVGDANANISESYDGWIDLFGWGTSGWNSGNTYYHPWDSDTPDDGFVYGPSGEYDLTSDYVNADWGVYNAISNGGNQAGLWRTLTQPEWDYVFNTRNTTSGIRFAMACLNNINGVILLPDTWNAETYSLNNTNNSVASYANNTLTGEQWSVLEQAGAVFLPAAGYRSGTSVNVTGSNGYYWSASHHYLCNAYRLHFYDGSLYTDDYYYVCRCDGSSVRLVRSTEIYSFEIQGTPSPAEGGSVTGSGTFQENATCTLTATANDGYTFVNWTESGQVVSTDATYSFTVTGDRNLVANFYDTSNCPLLYSFSDDDHTATVIGHCEEQNISGELVIPETVLHNGETYTVISIGNEAFKYCNLTAIEIPNSVISIGYLAFYCSALTTVSIGSSLSSMVGNPFANCNNLAQITVSLDNTTYDSRENCNAIIETSNNKLVVGCKNTVIPNTVTSIGYCAFYNCQGLTSVVIPGSVTTLDEAAFVFCSALTSITLISAVPPTLNVNSLGSVDRDIPVYIPCGSLSAYQNAEGWNEFTNFIEMCPREVAVTTNHAEYGTVSGGGSFEAGETCTVTATPNDGYYFLCWMEDGQGVSTEATYTFPVYRDHDLTAVFYSSLGEEMVINGDFEQGNVGFISEYWYYYAFGGAGQYYVDNNTHYPGLGHGGTGNFMMIDGATEPNVNIWTEEISVVPNTYYTLSTWVCTLNPESLALLQFSINGTQIGCVTAPSQTNTWQQYITLWYSGNVTVATITIIDQNTSGDGNDFGVDDISFREIDPSVSGGDHAYVDLGLPSGTLWATCNIGADAPEDYGDYFAWGETQPKSTYDWSTYQYCNGSSNTMTKYCSNSSYGYNGFTDDLTTLLPEDDAAMANWGDDWRMPTKEEWEELFQNTTHVWTTQNGVIGRLFTASNGYNLFLPAAGYYDYSDFYGASDYGSYWSSSPYIINSYDAYDFYFDSYRYGMDYTGGGRYCGHSVRAVRSSVQNTAPTGAINGLFSVGENTQVYFSQGNLQYQASTNTWQFAEHQWDFVGEGNTNASSTYEGWIDLFAWGTSGYDLGTVWYQPWSSGGDNAAYGCNLCDLSDYTGQADWGYNAISNGGNQEKLWRTCSSSEWWYLLEGRETTSGIRYVKAVVNGINGLVLLPDNWNSSIYELNNVNEGNASYEVNVISSNTWSDVFEVNGAVFLPAAGRIQHWFENDFGIVGFYWSSSSTEIDYLKGLLDFNNEYTHPGAYYSDERYAVRLIRHEANASYIIEAVSNPAGSGTITGTGTYGYYDQVALIANANAGYDFVNWTENGEVVSTDATYSFTVTGDRNIVANFSEIIIPTTNHWIPETESFEDNMTFTAVIQIDGVEQYSPMLEVGAFCGEQCRGSQLASLFEPTQRYLVQLTIFGETNDLISFRLYDHATEQELDLSSPAPVSFTSNGYGTLSNPFVLNFISAITQEQVLNNGWNWWSSYVELEGTNALEQLENSLGANGLIIKSRNNGYVEPYNDNGTIVWYGNLSALHNEQTYKVNTNGSCVASLTGLPVNPADHPITLNNGWNWIGYPSTQNVSIATALSGLDAAHDDIIKGRNGYASYYAENGYNGWYGTINTLEPGQGYMYRSNSNGTKTFTYAVGRGETTQANITPDHNFNKPQVDRFADNMTVTTVVELEGAELRSETYEIAAFVGDECRGSVKLMFVAPIDRYVAFLTVLGESGEAISFRLTDGVDTSLSEEEMTFVNDGIVGSLSDPATLRFGTLGVDESLSNTVSVYPNPSEDLFRIEGQGMRNIAVFNVYGQCVLSEAVNGDELTIDMRQYANGIYALRVVTDRGVISSTVVKQ